MQQTTVDRAGKKCIDRRNRQQQQKQVIVCAYLYMRYEKKCAAKHHVAPHCEIAAGTPIAGRHMNTAVVPLQVDIVLHVLRCGETLGWVGWRNHTLAGQ